VQDIASCGTHETTVRAEAHGKAEGRAMREIFTGLPWWVKWIAVPVIALVVFGGLIGSIVGFLAYLLFKLLIFVALVGGLIYVVRKFMSNSSSKSDW
jgi:hypothetical protein